MSDIPQVEDQGAQGSRQAQQGQSGSRQQGGETAGKFEYQNPRQQY